MRRILVELSAHGFGHLGQVAPVIARLRDRHRGLEITVKSGIDAKALRLRLGNDIDIVPTDVDFGVVESSPLSVDALKTLTAYRSVLDRCEELQASAQRLLMKIRPDLILCNAGFLTFQTAAQLAIPAIGMSSLNWAEILSAHAIEHPATEGVVSAIRKHYASALAFLRLAPGLPMHGLDNVINMGVVAQRGHARRSEILDRIGADRHSTLAVFAFGGSTPSPPNMNGIESEGFTLLGPRAWKHVPGFIVADELGFDFPDVIASADVVVTKLGYGIVAEAGLAGTPMLCYSRPGWPEDDVLFSWLAEHGQALRMNGTVAELSGASLRAAVARVRNLTAQRLPQDGCDELVLLLESYAAEPQG